MGPVIRQFEQFASDQPESKTFYWDLSEPQPPVQQCSWVLDTVFCGVSPDVIKMFQDAVSAGQLVDQFKQLLTPSSIDHVIETHHLTRVPGHVFEKELHRLNLWIDQIHSGKLLSHQNHTYQHVIVLALGGSMVGAKALLKSLKTIGYDAQMDCHFLSTCDIDLIHSILDQCDLSRTLFVTISKSGSTHEVHANDSAIRANLTSQGWSESQISSQWISITCPNSNLDDSQQYAETFYMDAHTSGRYSTTSVVGAVAIGLVHGPDTFNEILEGARDMDLGALNPSIHHNISLMAACVSVWCHSILNCETALMIPYSAALEDWNLLVQQLWCESNGKQVTRSDHEITYSTAPMITGDIGTNAQHSFFQWVYQGSFRPMVQFISVQKSTRSQDDTQHNLLTHMAAQLAIMSEGAHTGEPKTSIAGQIPATVLSTASLTPRSLGELLAYYENMIIFQSFIWDINGFDQEGVQHGKSWVTSLREDPDKTSIAQKILSRLTHYHEVE